MFFSRNKKNNVYSCALQLYYIKVGFEGVNIIWTCFLDENNCCPHIRYIWHNFETSCPLLTLKMRSWLPKPNKLLSMYQWYIPACLDRIWKRVRPWTIFTNDQLKLDQTVSGWRKWCQFSVYGATHKNALVPLDAQWQPKVKTGVCVFLNLGPVLQN